MYGCVIFACLSDIETVLTPANAVFSQAEIFIRTMLRWALGVPYDTRHSFLYVISNQPTL